MCVVSMIMDHYHDKWWERWNEQQKQTPPPDPQPPQYIPVPMPIPTITPEEIAEFKRLLDRAREYDKRMGEPDCELDEKRQALKKIAEEMGVEISFI